jgi:long-chain fatty acid transport protein
MKKLVFFVVILTISATIYANGLSLNSPGPKALGMGGAFIGLADDPSAIYWNPAGLADQDTEILFAVTDIVPFANYEWSYPAFGIEYDAKAEMKHYPGPNLFFNYRKNNLAFGFGAYVPAGVGVTWKEEDFGGKMMSKIGIINFSPAFAYRFDEHFSIGAAANIYYGMFEMDRFQDQSDTHQELTGLGYGAAFGFRYTNNDEFGVGLSYRTPVEVKFEGDGESSAIGNLDEIKADVKWPIWFGIGFYFKPQENWTLTFDTQYSNWNELEQIVEEIDFTHPQAGPMTIKDTLHMKWQDAIQLRIGTQYFISDAFSILGGFYYDPAPAPDKTNNILFPSSTNYAVSTGAIVQLEKLSIKFGVEYLFGQEREIAAILNNPANPLEGFTNEQPGKHQMDVFAFSLGLGLKL